MVTNHHIEIEDIGTDVYLTLLTMGLWALCFGSESFRTHVDVCNLSLVDYPA
jgi:hypothetical protein